MQVCWASLRARSLVELGAHRQSIPKEIFLHFAGDLLDVHGSNLGRKQECQVSYPAVSVVAQIMCPVGFQVGINPFAPPAKQTGEAGLKYDTVMDICLRDA